MAEGPMYMQVQSVIDERTTLICLHAAGMIEPVEEAEEPESVVDVVAHAENVAGQLQEGMTAAEIDRLLYGAPDRLRQYVKDVLGSVDIVVLQAEVAAALQSLVPVVAGAAWTHWRGGSIALAVVNVLNARLIRLSPAERMYALDQLERELVRAGGTLAGVGSLSSGFRKRLGIG